MAYYKLGDSRDDILFYEQNFLNEFTTTVSQATIVKMKNSGMLTLEDIEIAKYLAEFHFATLPQLLKYLRVKFPEFEKKELEIFKERLNLLVSNRVLNKFMLTDTKVRKTVHDDAFQIYCLDLGGKYLLGNYSQCNLDSWNTALNMKSPALIFKALDIGEFYMNILETCPKKLVSFRTEPQLRVGMFFTKPDADMCMDIKGEERHFILQFVSGEDYPHKYKERAYQIETLIATKAWEKYYGKTKKPVLLFVVKDEEAALGVGNFVEGLIESVEGSSLLLSTNARIRSKRLNESGGLLRCTNGKLQAIRATAFDPE